MEHDVLAGDFDIDLLILDAVGHGRIAQKDIDLHRGVGNAERGRENMRIDRFKTQVDRFFENNQHLVRHLLSPSVS